METLQNNNQNVLLAVVATTEQALANAKTALADTKWDTGLFLLCGNNFHVAKNTMKKTLDALSELELLIVLVAPEGNVALAQALSLSGIAKDREIPSVVLTADKEWQTGESITATLDMKYIKSRTEGIILVPISADSNGAVSHKAECPEGDFYQNVGRFPYLIDEEYENCVMSIDPIDVGSLFEDTELAYMGVGNAAGEGKNERAVKIACENAMSKRAPATAKKVIAQITASEDVGLADIEAVLEAVQQASHPDAWVLCGCTIREDYCDEIQVIVIATDFSE